MAASLAGVPACLAVGAAWAGILRDDDMPSSSVIRGDGGTEGDPGMCWAGAGSAAAGARDENTDPEQDQHSLELTSHGDGGGSASGAMELVATSGAAMHGGGGLCGEEQPSAIKASPRWVGDLFPDPLHDVAYQGAEGRNHI